MKFYGVELRRSILLPALPLMALIDIAAVFGRNQYWIGNWPQASAAAQLPALYFGPVLAGAAALAATRAHQAESAPLFSTSARPFWHREFTHLASTLTIGLGIYSLGVLAAFAVSVGAAGPGFLWPSYILLGAFTLVGCASVGHLAGRYATNVYMAPTLSIGGTFLILSWIGSPNAFELFVLSGSPGLKIESIPLALRGALSIALMALAVLAPEPARARSSLPPSAWMSRFSWVIAFLAALFLAVSIPTAGALRSERTPVSPLCSHGSPRVCVWPENRKYLPELAQMAERLNALPQKWVKTPTSFHESGLRPGHDDDFEVLAGQTRLAAVMMAGQVLYASVASQCKAYTREREIEVLNAMDRLGLWLEYRATGLDPKDADEGLGISGPTDTLTEARDAVSSSEGHQTQWTKKQVDTIQMMPCAQP